MEKEWQWGDEQEKGDFEEDRSIDYEPEDDEVVIQEKLNITEIFKLKERFDNEEELTTEELEKLMEVFL